MNYFCLHQIIFLCYKWEEGGRAVTVLEISIGGRSYVLRSNSISVNERQLQLLGASPTDPTGCCLDG